MSTRKLALALVLSATIAAVAHAAASAPPAAPVRAVVDTYHGTKVSDPYRYMETLQDPEVQAWAKAQAAHTTAALHALPGRAKLLARVKELDSGAPYTVYGTRQLVDGTLFFLKAPVDAAVPKLIVRDAKSGKDTTLIDPEKMPAPEGQHLVLAFFSPSPDGKYVLYGLAAGGSEKTDLRVREVATGRDLPDLIERIEDAYSWPTWLPDNKSFVYAQRAKLAADAPATDGFKNSRVFLHKLGADPTKDTLLLGVGTSPALPLVDTDFPSVLVPRASRFAVAQVKQGDNNEIALFSASLAELAGGKPAWRRVCDFADQVEDFAVLGDTIYLKSAKGAPRYQLLAVPLDKPELAKAKVVVPGGESVINGLTAAKDGIYLNLLDGGQVLVQRLDVATGTLEPLPLPSGMSAYLASSSPLLPGVFAHTASYIKGATVLRYDPAARQWTDTGLQPKGAFDDLPGLEVEEVKVKSHDGTLVPLSLVRQRGLARDGTHPTLLYGYGSYGISMTPWFDPTLVAFLERGGVFAVAHVRGGGEYGKPWHEAGRMLSKPNTWKDFIACAEWLIAQKYTTAARLAGSGGSAGGILIGRAITERPELFGAAIIGVGMSDTVRAETTTNGVPNIKEFGSVASAEGFQGLLAMSPYHHVVDKTRYPAVLLIHGINDPRVDPWMSFKLAARLQAASSSGKPVLLRVDYDAGHGIGSTRQQAQEQTADELSFLLWQAGDKELQPPAANKK